MVNLITMNAEGHKVGLRISNREQGEEQLSANFKNGEKHWQPGDGILVNLDLCAHEHGGQWNVVHAPGALKLIEIRTNDENY